MLRCVIHVHDARIDDTYVQCTNSQKFCSGGFTFGGMGI